MAAHAVQSLWIGERLSTMERLSIQSYLDHGHAFHLYAYGSLANVPAGTQMHDASEILAADEIFYYQQGCGRGSPAGFADLFRYRLLLERGGWWSDLDAVCLRPLEFADDHILGWEREKDGSWHVANGLIKAPAGSRLMQVCWERCRQIDRSNARWGQTGPRLVAEVLREMDFSVRILPPDAFYPIDYFRFHHLVAAGRWPTASHSVHLWNSRWRREGLDPDARYRPDCLYERLKRTHCVASPAGSPRGDGGLLGRSPHFVRKLVTRLGRVRRPRRCPPGLPA